MKWYGLYGLYKDLICGESSSLSCLNIVIETMPLFLFGILGLILIILCGIFYYLVNKLEEREE